MGEDIREVGVSRQCRRMAGDALQACAALSGTEVSWKEASHRAWDPGELAPSQKPGLGSWAIPQPPCSIPVFKENGAAGAKYLIKSFLSRGGTARTQQDKGMCKLIPVLGCPGGGRYMGGWQDEEPRGRSVSASQPSLLSFCSPSSFSKEAGGAGKTEKVLLYGHTSKPVGNPQN